MPEPATSQISSDRGNLPHRSLFERFTAFILREPENREQLLGLLHDAQERRILDADALSMIEGVLQVSQLRARDIMVPRAQMTMLDLSESVADWIPKVIATAHSRFPVYDTSRDDVVGILLAKDLLRLSQKNNPDARGMLRPAVFIPESKPLDVLLRDFRAKRNHMAIVVDEYGGVTGLITIEDVLEQIVGDINDEYDFDNESTAAIKDMNGSWRVHALTSIEQFNELLGTHLDETAFDTIGGLITDQYGRVPRRGDVMDYKGIHFEVLRGDARQAQLLRVSILSTPAEAHTLAIGYEESAIPS